MTTFSFEEAVAPEPTTFSFEEAVTPSKPVREKPSVKDIALVPVGVAESAASLGTAAIATPLAGLSGIAAAFAKTLGITDTEAATVVQKVQEALTYQPRTKAGGAITGAVAYPFEKVAEGADVVGQKVTDTTGSPALGAAANTGIQFLTPLGAAKGVSAAKAAVPKARAALSSPVEPAMAGVGSAETSLPALRVERAEALPVPIKLTKGQATRDFETQRFEREEAKAGKTGEPLRQRFAEQNEQILQNFDTWVDEIGAHAPDLRAVGQGVDQVLVAKVKQAKKEIDDAYTKARNSEEGNSLVPTDALVEYIEANRPAALNAPVLSSVEQKLIQLGGAADEGGKLTPKSITLNEMEELRKFVGKVAKSDDTNMHFGKEVKQVIDTATEGRGGELFNHARSLRTKYGKEFEDRAVINRLLSHKPGTTDRSVAFEDVFAHSILNGSLDDVRHVRRVLQTAGPDGAAAWRELQGATINHIKEQATKNVARDTRGNPIVSASALDKAIVNLDRDGKLDFVFGKKGAAQLRDINDLAKDVFTSPPGAVNTSGTASVLMDAMGELALGRLSIGTAKALTTAKQLLRNRKTKRRINESLEYSARRDELLRGLEEP